MESFMPLALGGSVLTGGWFYVLFKLSRKIGAKNIHSAENDIKWSVGAAVAIFIEYVNMYLIVILYAE